jgi:hypothetical protein
MHTTVNEDNVRSRERILRLEEDVHRIPGVRSARIVGVAVPTKVHIVAGVERDAADMIASIQALAESGYGVRLDERIISVAQLDASGEVVTHATNGVGHRPLIERVVVANIGSSAWVKVVLKWPDATKTEGSSPAGVSRESRAKGAATAAAHALKPVLGTRDASVFIDHVVLQQVGSKESVLVFADFNARGETVSVTGSSLAHDDLTNAAVRALLQAVNRKIETS